MKAGDRVVLREAEETREISARLMQEAITRDAIRRALNGDRMALRQLVDALTPAIQARVARVLLRTGCQGRRGTVRQEVEDLSQQVFERLFEREGRALLEWNQDKGLGLPQYVSLVAEREVIDILRSKRRSPYTERPTEDAQLEASGRHEEGAESGLVTRQMAAKLCSRLEGSLSPLGFRVFLLLFRDEQPAEIVCKELGMSADALYAWRSRIRKAARELAEELSSEGVRP